MPRHTHARRGERAPIVVKLVRPDKGRILLSGFLWGAPANEHVSLSPAMAYELGRELIDTAESVLMGETWPVEALQLVTERGRPARGAAETAARPIRPGQAVESRG